MLPFGMKQRQDTDESLQETPFRQFNNPHLSTAFSRPFPPKNTNQKNIDKNRAQNPKFYNKNPCHRATCGLHFLRQTHYSVHVGISPLQHTRWGAQQQALGWPALKRKKDKFWESFMQKNYGVPQFFFPGCCKNDLFVGRCSPSFGGGIFKKIEIVFLCSQNTIRYLRECCS